MYRGANPFLHKQIDSPIQRMSSFYKILSIFVFLILLVVANSFVDMIVLSFYLFVIIFKCVYWTYLGLEIYRYG